MVRYLLCAVLFVVCELLFRVRVSLSVVLCWCESFARLLPAVACLCSGVVVAWYWLLLLVAVFFAVGNWLLIAVCCVWSVAC